jgi:hypothetical protein
MCCETSVIAYEELRSQAVQGLRQGSGLAFMITCRVVGRRDSLYLPGSKPNDEPLYTTFGVKSGCHFTFGTTLGDSVVCPQLALARLSLWMLQHGNIPIMHSPSYLDFDCSNHKRSSIKLFHSEGATRTSCALTYWNGQSVNLAPWRPLTPTNKASS